MGEVIAMKRHCRTHKRHKAGCYSCDNAVFRDGFNLRRGTIVRAKRHLDPSVANVMIGTLGVVYEESNAYGDECGPMVRWFTGTTCNVYKEDVEEK